MPAGPASDAPTYEFLADVVVLRLSDGKWLLYNVFTRTSLAVGTAALALIDRVAAGEAPAGGDETFAVWESGWFSNADGLYADPTRIRRGTGDLPPPETLGTGALVERLCRRFILTDDKAAYLERFRPKQSAFDFERFGDFHQQLGQHLVAERRADPEAWWQAQKFTDDGLSIRDGPYKDVQERLVREVVEKTFRAGERVLDLGCGNGHFTEMIAATGADATGLDPSEQLIAAAQGRAGAKAQYRVADVGRAGALDAVADGSIDAVFMSDALLFYFVPPGPDWAADLDVLLDDAARVLKPGGRFIAVDPHPVFWLAPWFGEPARPWTVVTEYRRRDFGVVAPTAAVVRAFAGHGFALTGLEDGFAEADAGGADDRARGFAREFPLWRLVAFTKRPGAD